MTAAGGLFILSNMREYGGAERSLAALVPFLAAETPLRIFVENERHGAELAALGHPRVTIVRMPQGNSPMALVGALIRLRRHLRAERPRAVLANGHKGALLLALARSAASGARLAVYVRDFAYRTMPLLTRRLRDALFVAPGRGVFAHPAYVRAGLARCRQAVVPNAVAPATVQVPDEDFIGCCARLVRWKGVDHLLRAWASIAAGFPAVKLRVMGEPVDAAYAMELRRLAADLGIRDRVDFAGFLADLDRLYAGLFYVVPSLPDPPGPETFGRVVIEAWSRGRPVVAFRCGGPAELIADGEDGYLVPPGQVEALAERMAALLRDPAQRRAMGARGRARTEQEFSPPAIARRLLGHLLAP